MKIRLVEPKSKSHNVYDHSRLPRLGLPQIGARLVEHGHDVKIYVESLAPIDVDDLLSADLVGFSTTTGTTPPAYELADRLREQGRPVVFGGAHVTFLPDEGLQHADYVVRGEGHTAMLELVEALETGGDVSQIAGLSYHDVNGPVHNPDRPFCPEAVFADLPEPDLRLIVGHEAMLTMPIMTQWGCPFNCNFCSVIKMFGRRVRARHVEDVLDQLERVPPGKDVFFYDDNFVVSKPRTLALLRGMRERGIYVPWSAQVRAEVIYADPRGGAWDTELLQLMHDTGCQYVYVGFESVNPDALLEFNKRQTVETIAESIRAFHAYDILVHGMFVLGCDADTRETIKATVDFAIDNAVDTVQFLAITPLPGTDFYEQMRAEGRLISDDWSLYDGHHVLIEPKHMTPYELQVEVFRAMLRFYAPRRALGMLARNIRRELPFLLRLLARERKLRLVLPRIALLSLRPADVVKIPPLLQQVLDHDAWRRLREVFIVPAFRQYAYAHTRQGIRQPENRRYLDWLKRREV